MNARLADATLGAYERWAPIYPPFAHNPLMRVEERAMLERWPEVAGRRALDLACGTGRYARRLAKNGARSIVALDYCVPMLERVSASNRVCADMMALPFVNNSFDVVISGLALGHASAVKRWIAEIARVLAPGGALLYSDFHPEAARAGLTRSFKDEHDQTRTVPHRCFDVASQEQAIALAGLRIEALHEVRVGEELREPFAHSEEFYRRWDGLPIVLVIRARKLTMETA
jgi:ubiquinone/menaquinone biosynthesis C-methylase UbiE